jgi:hypothetical protein
MTDTVYTVSQAKKNITNTKDVLQGASSPRWTPEFWAVVKTTIAENHEGEVWAWGPSLKNEFEVIEDDLVKKY